MKKLLACVSLAILVLLAADNPLEGDKFLEKADEKFYNAATLAQEAYAKAMAQTFETRLKTYKSILAAATKAGDFDRATAVKIRIEEIEAEAKGVGHDPSSKPADGRHAEEFDLLKVVPVESTSNHTQWKEDAVYVTSPAKLRYRIPATARRFRTTGALIAPGNVKLLVHVDGVLTVSSPTIEQGKEFPIDIAIPKGAKLLDLVVDPNGPLSFDGVHWTRPRFEK